MKKADKIWWIKLVASFGVALVTLAAQLYMNMSGEMAFMLGIILYIVLSEALASIVGIERIRSLKIGVGAFLFTWVMVWTLAYTIVKTLG